MSLSELPAAASTPSSGIGGRPLSSDDLVVLNDEIRAFVRAGIPLEIGLRGTAGRTSGVLGRLTERLADRMEMGASIEEAMAAEGGGLPMVYRAVLQAGLRSGRLDDVLTSLSELAESTSTLRRQLQLSVIYPVAVVTLALLLFGFFAEFMLPQLERTYEVFDLRRSAWIDGVFWFMQAYSVPQAAVGAAIIVALVSGFVATMGRFVPTGIGENWWVPGGRELALARFSRVMSLLVEHHVPLPEACRLSGQAAGDARLNQSATRLASMAERGQSLPVALDGSRLPPFLRWLMTVGERQGSLAASLRQAADVYEQRALTKMEWFRRIVPPVAIVLCCGSITLLYALTLFLPIAEMFKQLGVG